VSEPLSVLGVGVDLVADGVGGGLADDFLFSSFGALGVSPNGGVHLFVEVLELLSLECLFPLGELLLELLG